MQNFRIENFQSVSSAPEYNFGDWRTTNILFDEKRFCFTRQNERFISQLKRLNCI